MSVFQRYFLMINFISFLSFATHSGFSLEYRIQEGDNLSQLAESFGLKKAELKSANQLKSDMLKIGQKLYLPSLENIETSPYTIQKGDSLSSLSVKTGLSVEFLAAYLPKKKTHPLIAGNLILLPMKKKSSAQPSSPTQGGKSFIRESTNSPVKSTGQSAGKNLNSPSDKQKQLEDATLSLQSFSQKSTGESFQSFQDPTLQEQRRAFGNVIDLPTRIQIQEGDTFFSLSKKYQLPVEELQRLYGKKTLLAGSTLSFFTHPMPKTNGSLPLFQYKTKKFHRDSQATELTSLEESYFSNPFPIFVKEVKYIPGFGLGILAEDISRSTEIIFASYHFQDILSTRGQWLEKNSYLATIPANKKIYVWALDKKNRKIIELS